VGEQLFCAPTDAAPGLTMAKYLFGNYLLDVDERRLLRENEDIHLRGKLFDTLRVLVENAGKLVRKDAFMESVWPDSIVEDNNLDLTALPGTIVATNPTGATNLDIAITTDGKFLYSLDGEIGKISIFGIQSDGTLTNLGTTGALPKGVGFNGIAAN
jgi:hypothetical protein